MFLIVVRVFSDGGAVSTVRRQESVSAVAQENRALGHLNVKVSILAAVCMHVIRKSSRVTPESKLTDCSFRVHQFKLKKFYECLAKFVGKIHQSLVITYTYTCIIRSRSVRINNVS